MFLKVFQHAVDGFGGLSKLREPLQKPLKAGVLPPLPRRAAPGQAHLAEEHLEGCQIDVVVPVHGGKEREQAFVQVTEVPAELLHREAASGNVAAPRPLSRADALPLEVAEGAVAGRQVEDAEVTIEGEDGAAPAVGQAGDLPVGLGETLHEGDAQPAQRLHEGLAGQQRHQAPPLPAGEAVGRPQPLGGAAPQRGQLPVLGAAPAVQHHEGGDAAGPQAAEKVAHRRREGAVVAAAAEVGGGGEAQPVVEAAPVDDQLGVPHPQLGEERPALLHEARQPLDAHDGCRLLHFLPRAEVAVGVTGAVLQSELLFPPAGPQCACAASPSDGGANRGLSGRAASPPCPVRLLGPGEVGGCGRCFFRLGRPVSGHPEGSWGILRGGSPRRPAALAAVRGRALEGQKPVGRSRTCRRGQRGPEEHRLPRRDEEGGRDGGLQPSPLCVRVAGRGSRGTSYLCVCPPKPSECEFWLLQGLLAR